MDFARLAKYVYIQAQKTTKNMKLEMNKRMNLTLTRESYELLKKQAKLEHLLPSTYAKQILLKNLPINNNDENEFTTKNGKDM